MTDKTLFLNERIYLVLVCYCGLLKTFANRLNSDLDPKTDGICETIKLIFDWKSVDDKMKK